MKETGEILKQARLKKNVELEEVVLSTKIKLSTLKAIEEGDGDNLPSKAFIRGFVQSYARYLEVDDKLVMDTFYKEMGSTITVPNLTKTSHHADTEGQAHAVNFANSKRHPLFKFIIAGGTIILLIGIFLVNQTIEKYEQERKVVNPEKLEQENLEPIVQEDSKEETDSTAKAEAEMEKDSNDTETSANNKVAKQDTVNESPKADAKKPEDKSTADKAAEEKEEKELAAKKEQEKLKAQEVEKKKAEAEAQKKADEEKLAKQKAEEEKKKAEEKAKVEAVAEKKNSLPPVAPMLGSQEIILEALDKLKVEFKTDNGKWTSFTLSPEQIHTIKAKKNIELKISDGGSVNVIHNGRDKGVPGNLGESISLKYP